MFYDLRLHRYRSATSARIGAKSNLLFLIRNIASRSPCGLLLFQPPAPNARTPSLTDPHKETAGLKPVVMPANVNVFQHFLRNRPMVHEGDGGQPDAAAWRAKIMLKRGTILPMWIRMVVRPADDSKLLPGRALFRPATRHENQPGPRKRRGAARMKTTGLNPPRASVLGALCVGVAWGCLAPSARALEGYLPMVGPPPLRFFLSCSDEFHFVAFETSQQAKALELAATASATAPPDKPAGKSAGKPADPTSPAAQPSPPAITESAQPVLPVLPVIPMGPDVNDEAISGGAMPPPASGNFSFPSQTASDLLPVSPQMIAQYFRPDPNGTNNLNAPGGVLVAPGAMPFVPPPLVPVPESRASYHVR